MPHATAIHCVPEPCQVLGTPLKPFCLGHHLLFKKLGLAFAGSPIADATPDQSLMGIAICAGASYEVTLTAQLSGEWDGLFARWRRRLNGPWYHRRKPDFEDAEALFRAYLADGYQQPPVWRYESDPDPDAIEITTPWELLLECQLVRSGYSRSEVLNEYLRAVWYRYYAVREIHAAEVCKDRKKWRRVFYTAEHEHQMEASNG